MAQKKKKQKTITIPMLPLRGIVVFPNMILHFDVGRPKSISALEEAMMKDQKIFLAAQKEHTFTAPVGPEKGISEIDRAIDEPIIDAISGE